MIFTFASLAAGISCGVYAYVIGIVGTIGFCAIAFILRFSPLSKETNLTGTLNFEFPKSSDDIATLEAILTEFCLKFIQVKYEVIQPKIKKDQEATTDKKIAYEYNLKLKSHEDFIDLDTALCQITSIKSLKLSFTNMPENV
jgi:uncharacterized membrane protein YhiD involved in acid resistance